MPRKDDGTSVERPPQRRNQDHIDFYVFHEIPCFLALSDPVFSDFYIEVLPIKLGIQVGLTIGVICTDLVLDLLLSEVVSGFCVSDEIDHFKQYIWDRQESQLICPLFLVVRMTWILTIRVDIISMRASQQQQPRTKSQQKSLWKLPYLNTNNNMPIPSQTHRKKHSLPRHRFDLNTNFASIPRYSALQDKNLAYFFDKTKNRRIVENLKQEQDRKKRKKESKTYRQQRLTKEVSQIQFIDYLQKMKEKAKERKDLP